MSSLLPPLHTSSSTKGLPNPAIILIGRAAIAKIVYRKDPENLQPKLILIWARSLAVSVEMQMSESSVYGTWGDALKVYRVIEL